MISSTASRLPVWLKSSSISRRTTALFSSDIGCPPFSRFPQRIDARRLYCAAKRSAAHEANALFLPSRRDAWAESQRVACLYLSATGLPTNTILGNSEGIQKSRSCLELRPSLGF